MTISRKAFFHGAALFDIVEDEHFTSINTYPNAEMNSAYSINHNIGIYMKYSAEDESPWHFNFKPDHKRDIRKMFEKYGAKTFICLICSSDGICVVPYSVYKNCVEENFTDQEDFVVTRDQRESYRVRGVKGEYPRVIHLNDFPKSLFE
jgi:hypothetical protein